MEDLGCDAIEFGLAVGEIQQRWNNEELIKKYPIPKD